ncbi:MAG: ABC transporter ATP-binding protein [Gorillibacterium sp.]|nr:ABC transporter ATP-binding protein [Gorillibacterium sp.]
MEKRIGNVENTEITESLLSFTNVSKSYGKRKALHDVSFNLGPGKIVGLLGSNGSGKTTLMKIAAGVSSPSSGIVSILGRSPGIATRAVLSFMPDQSVTESWMNVRDAIGFYHDFYPDFDAGKASEMLEFMKLKPEDHVSAMSKGMSERLQLVLAMSRKARLYLLDEPLGGVDPVARDRIMDALVQFYDQDSSIIISTHLVSDIERIFDEVIFIKDGLIALHEEVEILRLNHGKSVDELFKEVYAEC